MSIHRASRRGFLALASAAALSACASSGVATGTYKAGPDFQVTLGESWGDITNWQLDRPPGLRLLTIDGELLNRLYISEGMKAGGFLVRRQSRDRPTPTYRPGMSSRELVEFVADSVAALGYVLPETENPRPAKFGAVDGVRVEIKAVTINGLEMAGTALFAERREKLYLMLYLAPREHYFAARLGEVEKVFASATLAP